MSKKPLNIFLLHNKKDMYLSYTIKRLKTLHPSDNIYLLGTQYNNCYSGINHHMMKDYMTSANTFQEVYWHIGTSFYDLELTYFQRWFILKDFCESHSIDNMFYLDSYVLCCKSLHVFDDMIANEYDIGGGEEEQEGGKINYRLYICGYPCCKTCVRTCLSNTRITKICLKFLRKGWLSYHNIYA